jgi:hypothetical protein
MIIAGTIAFLSMLSLRQGPDPSLGLNSGPPTFSVSHLPTTPPSGSSSNKNKDELSVGPVLTPSTKWTVELRFGDTVAELNSAPHSSQAWYGEGENAPLPVTVNVKTTAGRTDILTFYYIYVMHWARTNTSGMKEEGDITSPSTNTAYYVTVL